MANSVAFQVMITGSQPSRDVLDLWEVEEYPFTTAGEVGSIWRAELPADHQQAANLLDTQAFQLRQTNYALRSAVPRLQAELGTLENPDEVHYAEGTHKKEVSLDSPHSVLKTAMQWSKSTDSGRDFGLPTADTLQLVQTMQIINQFIEQVHRTVSQFALVETVSGGRLVGTTRVAWSGDLETKWQSSFGPEYYVQHNRLVRHALGTRQTWLRFLLLMTAGVTRVAATLATGPFSILAIWATWNFLKQVVAEYRQLRVQFPSISGS
jgi:hypothetical protein